IVVSSALTVLLLALWMDGFIVESVPAAILVTLAFLLAESAYWWLFVSFFSWLPVWLYPIVTFILSGITVLVAGNLVPGITINGIGTGIWISLWITAVNAVIGGIFSLDQDEAFDRDVTRK